MNVQARAKKIKLLLLDVDGVLTDGKIIISNSGQETKNFSVRDGLGILLLKMAEIKCAILTAKSSRLVRLRARHLRMDGVYENHYKLELLEKIMRELSVSPDEVCFVGDDLVDIPILKRVGLAVSVPNGVQETKNTAHFITKASGGNGAVREVCELILKAQNKWAYVTRRYNE